LYHMRVMERRDSVKSRDWSPFVACAEGARAAAPRSIDSPAGVGDRLRTAAFAELTAREAFRWAAEEFSDAPEALRDEWIRLVGEEDKHLGWLLGRMKELGVDPAGRPVSTRLWEALMRCAGAREFETLIAQAEERGRLAGESVKVKLEKSDPRTAEIFGRIAREESEHVAVAGTFFPPETSK